MTSRRPIAALGLLLLAVVLVPADAASVEVVKDGSFESTPASEDNPNWQEGWLVFPPICDSTCTEDGQGGGTVGPRTGSNWVWFGGTLSAEQQFVAQDVTIPPGPATLSFYLWLGADSGNGLDVFLVLIDGRAVIEVEESAQGFATYSQVILDVGSYTGTHELSFDYQGFGGGVTNFSLDDISLQAGPPVPKSVTLLGPKKVSKGKKAALNANVQPCAGHENDTIELYRGKKKLRTAQSDASCNATFKVKIQKTSTFRAVSPKQDADHEAGTSQKLKVRVRKA